MISAKQLYDRYHAAVDGQRGIGDQVPQLAQEPSKVREGWDAVAWLANHTPKEKVKK